MRTPGHQRRPVELKYMLAVAMLTVGTVGAMAGSAIGATAMTYDSSFGYEKPEHASLPSFVRESRTSPPLPDHYALETREGRVEVAELKVRGLYASPRFAERVPQYPADWETDEASDLDTASPTNSSYAPPAIELAQPASEDDTGVTVIRGTSRSVATVSITAEERSSTAPLRPLFQGG